MAAPETDISDRSGGPATATVTLVKDGESTTDAATADGPVLALPLLLALGGVGLVTIGVCVWVLLSSEQPAGRDGLAHLLAFRLLLLLEHGKQLVEGQRTPCSQQDRLDDLFQLFGFYCNILLRQLPVP